MIACSLTMNIRLDKISDPFKEYKYLWSVMMNLKNLTIRLFPEVAAAQWQFE